MLTTVEEIEWDEIFARFKKIQSLFFPAFNLLQCTAINVMRKSLLHIGCLFAHSPIPS